jgi:transcriptional regulator of acetoin/glycerol metabolism
MILKEEIAGTNAVSLAIREKKTIIVIKEQHYIEELKKLSCLASPIFNRDGNLIGVVDISSENDIGHDFAALIFLLARDIERNYQII